MSAAVFVATLGLVPLTLTACTREPVDSSEQRPVYWSSDIGHLIWGRLSSSEDGRKRVERPTWGAILFCALVSLNSNRQSHFTHGGKWRVVAACPARQGARLTATSLVAGERATLPANRLAV